MTKVVLDGSIHLEGRFQGLEDRSVEPYQSHLYRVRLKESKVLFA